MRTFRLYPSEQHWWTFDDYGALLSVVERLRPRRVLEFGPGSSTLALLEGGVDHVDALEDDEVYLERHRENLALYSRACLRYYRHADPLVIPGLAGQHWDMAFVDGPRRTEDRGAEIAYALAHCDAVVCHDARSVSVAAALARPGMPIEEIEAGGNTFGLVVRP